jgi:hypothetical protein
MYLIQNIPMTTNFIFSPEIYTRGVPLKSNATGKIEYIGCTLNATNDSGTGGERHQCLTSIVCTGGVPLTRHHYLLLVACHLNATNLLL